MLMVPPQMSHFQFEHRYILWSLFKRIHKVRRLVWLWRTMLLFFLLFSLQLRMLHLVEKRELPPVCRLVWEVGEVGEESQSLRNLFPSAWHSQSFLQQSGPMLMTFCMHQHVKIWQVDHTSVTSAIKHITQHYPRLDNILKTIMCVCVYKYIYA